MTVALFCAVQHHPSRADLLPDLLAALEPLPVVVVTDPDPDARPSPWRTYLECLRAMPDDCTHLLVCQDDAMPCEGFPEAAIAALTARPDRPVAFFAAGFPQDNCVALRRASKLGKRWTDISAWQCFPCVASAWPRELVTRLVRWAETPEIAKRLTRCDDAVLGTFLTRHHIVPLATVPSLVQHPDETPSLIGRTARGGRDRNRTACMLVQGDACALVWT